MADKRTTLVMMLRDEVSKTAQHIQGELTKTHQGAMGTILTGVGLGAGISAFNLFGSAVRGATDFVGGAIAAAAEEEAQIAQLSAALQANASDWDGNVDAVEAAVEARKSLAFSDAELRDSLTALLPVTGSLAGSLDAQKTAMDLARLKGISLESASEKLGRALMGQGRVLKELGINLDDGATKTEVLAAVQAKAAGQAAAYASSTEGTLTKTSNAWDDFVENVGGGFISVADGVARQVEFLTWQNKKAVESGGALAELMTILPPAAEAMGVTMEDWAAETAAVAQEQRSAAAWTARLSAAAADGERKIRLAADAEREARDWATKLRDELPKLADEFRNTARAARESKLDEHWDLKALPWEIEAAKQDVRDAQKDLEAARGTEQEAAARVRLIRARQELDTLRARLQDMKGDYGRTGALLGSALAGSLYREVVDWNRKTRRELAALGDLGANRPPKSGNQNPDRNADGGPVQAGRVTIVGEEGPELFVPESNGFIIPNGGGGTPMAAPRGGGSLTVHFHSTWPPTPAQAREIAELLDRELYFAASVAPVSAR